MPEGTPGLQRPDGDVEAEVGAGYVLLPVCELYSHPLFSLCLSSSGVSETREVAEEAAK